MIVEVRGSIEPALRVLRAKMAPEFRLLNDKAEPKRSKRRRNKKRKAEIRRQRKARQRQRNLEQRKKIFLGRL